MFKNTLISPQAVNNIVYDKLVSFEVNAETGKCSVRIQRCDDSDQVIDTVFRNFFLETDDLEDIATKVFAAAQVVGITAAGTITKD